MPGKKSERTVFTMAKFTIPDDKCLEMCIRDRYKTVRKYYGEAIVVTQEVDDIISLSLIHICR